MMNNMMSNMLDREHPVSQIILDLESVNFNNPSEVISCLLEKLVIHLREHFIRVYGSSDLNGYCNMATATLMDMFYNQADAWLSSHDIPYSMNAVHGELRHNIRIQSKYWYIEHTWWVITINGITYYVDATSSQFADLYSNIPDYYISTKKPEWYYPDKENVRYNKPFSLIEGKIKIPSIFCGHSTITKVFRPIEFLQFSVWGSICDIVRTFVYGD